MKTNRIPALVTGAILLAAAGLAGCGHDGEKSEIAPSSTPPTYSSGGGGVPGMGSSSPMSNKGAPSGSPSGNGPR